jgi:DivIVA domain-containing protein
VGSEEEGVDRDSIDRIRSATFPVGRRGYEKREVDRFLNKLADWLETGGGNQTRAELLRRDLERVGQQTGKILTDAHDVAEQVKAEAEREARGILDDANQRRADIEAVIADLEDRRDTLAADLKRLSSELAGAAGKRRPIEEAAADEAVPRG